MTLTLPYEYYCKELFVVKSKPDTAAPSAIYFNLDPEIIKENCEFKFYFNKTDMKLTVFDGRHQIILANWPSYKKIMCAHNNNNPNKHTQPSICAYEQKHPM